MKATIDGPADMKVMMDGLEDGLACSAGLKPFYKNPGCGGEAIAVCAEADDGCFGDEICLCDGRTSRRCTWSEAPFRHLGACGNNDGGNDGTADMDAPTSCNCGPGRTCHSNAIYASGCSVCQCQPNGQSLCQAIACPDGGIALEPARCEVAPGGCQGDCVYDQGCTAPRAYCSPTKCSGTFGVGTFCGCDGVTFTGDCPRRPYRHVGACGS